MGDILREMESPHPEERIAERGGSDELVRRGCVSDTKILNIKRLFRLFS